VVPAADLDAAVAAIVDSLAHGPAFALRGAKRLVRDSLSRTLSEQLQAEAVSFGRCTAHPDFAEGINAFLQKRAPKFGAT
jgi:2-(1,2-epoxy-1,2-dihydrophenyl)acetyl-CoA isomerase